MNYICVNSEMKYMDWPCRLSFENMLCMLLRHYCFYTWLITNKGQQIYVIIAAIYLFYFETESRTHLNHKTNEESDRLVGMGAGFSSVGGQQKIVNILLFRRPSLEIISSPCIRLNLDDLIRIAF